jgi:copper chaperone NosL
MKRRRIIPFAVAAAIMVIAFAGCSQGPREIDLGKEECAHCKMTITDARFAAELVTHKSKVYVYDAIECLAAAINEEDDEDDDGEEEIASLWVMDYNKPGTFINAEKAWYHRSEEYRSPMGMNLAAFETKEQYDAAAMRTVGLLYRWTGVRLLVAKEWD